jgi:hypothetical protein
MTNKEKQKFKRRDTDHSLAKRTNTFLQYC